jgi:hypothetical protein
LQRLLAVLAVILACGTVLAAQPADAARPRVTDAELVGGVRSALHASFGTAARRIDVRAQDGYVFLYGEAPSERLRARAETIAQRVAGVRAVSNELDVAATAPPGERPILGRTNPRRSG